MLRTPELLIPLGAALFVVVLLLLLRARAARNRGGQRVVSRGPANLRFVCAGCEGQFTHSRRTLGAWEKGTRRFYCNPCHAKWRGSHPAQPAQPVRAGATETTGSHPRARRSEPASVGSGSTSRTRFQSARSGSGSGCLGTVLLLVAVPIALGFLAVQYA